MSYDVILFDVDGTLCDPGNSLIESARYALKQMGIDESDDQALRRFIGPPLEHSFRDYYDFDETQIKQAVGHFRTYLQGEGLKLYTPYRGIRQLLETLSSKGKTLAVVTSKIDNIARDALRDTGLIDYCKVIGAQQAGEVVAKEVILKRVLDELAIKSTQKIVMIGDRKHDIEAANEHGIDSVGVLYGYGTRKELVDEGATYIAEDSNELENILS